MRLFSLLSGVFIFFCAIFLLLAEPNKNTNSNSLINKEQISLINNYKLAPSAINHFPFADYQVIRSATQGSFYIEMFNRDYIKHILSSNQTWEPEIIKLLQKYAKPGTIALDIGAHIGTHAITMSRAVQKEGLVLAFEPGLKIHSELVQNLRLNECHNTIPIHAGLGEKSGVAYLEPIRNTNEGYRCISSKNQNEKINLLRLDDFNLSNVSCIKIDTESYELEVLKGAYNTIMTNRPVILIEIGGGISREQEEKINPEEHLLDVLNMLENELNYEVITISLISKDYLALPK